MATKEELQLEADAEVEAAKPITKSVDGVTSELTEEEYAQHKIDIGNYKWEEQQFGYINARQSAYGSIASQLDMMYWDEVNGTTTWKDHIAKVKSDNPKPE
tara:strand:- start:1023 stop:1325 length:303 start_codon:yes stop_codon:yes gene_type:complete